jgi:hypothetical protein
LVVTSFQLPYVLDAESIISICLWAWLYNKRVLLMDIKRQKIDCLRFVMCPLLALARIPSLFLMWPLTVLTKQTRQAVRTIKQSILLRCLWSYWILVSSFMTSCDSVVGISVSVDSVIRDGVTLSYWPSLNGEMCFGHFKHCWNFENSFHLKTSVANVTKLFCP